MATLSNGAAGHTPGRLFVTGTGRCGSTLVSGLLREHPHVLSLSELFNTLTDMYRLTAEAFPEGKVTAERFWQILSARNTVNGLLHRHGLAPEEILYPASATARFTPETGVPAILLTPLPHLTHDPDALYDELATAVAAFPDAPVGEHYTRLFAWLCARFGKRVWAERSGGSLTLLGQYRHHFPHAKYLHVVRDGRDCALSMSRHSGFRMGALVMALIVSLGRDPYAGGQRAAEGSALGNGDGLGNGNGNGNGLGNGEGLGNVPEELWPFLPDRFDPQAFRDYRIPASLFGTFWSDEIARGMVALSGLPEDQVLHLWYEDILARPEESLRRIAEFLGPDFVDEDWERRCAALVARPTCSWRDLPQDERRELDEACLPGFSTLAAHGLARTTDAPVTQGATI